MKPAKSILIGVDLGTSSLKVVAFDTRGRVLASASRKYPVRVPRPNWSEQDPDAWWRAARAALREVTAALDPQRIAGVSFSGQMHGSVFLDSAGKVIRPCLLWNDGRTAPQCEQIVAKIGREALLSRIRNLPLTSFTLPKLLWLAQHEKANYKRLKTLLLPKDYLRFRLTGVAAMDVSDGAGTVMMRVGEGRWDQELLRQLGLNPAVLPPLVESTAVAGHVTAAAARATGLPAGTPVVAGGGDQPVGAVGTGVFSPGQAMISLGTSGVVLAPTAKALTGGAAGLASFDHAVPGVSYLMGCVMSAAGAFEWFVQALCPEILAGEGSGAYEAVLRRAAKVAPGAEGLLFLPYLTGERTPWPDPNARGVFFGLAQNHTRDTMARAVIEGVCFSLRAALEAIRERGVTVREVRVTGGGAKSPFWLQLLADVLGLPLRPVSSAEGPALGAAILAGIGVGVYADFAQADRQAIRLGKAIRPNAARGRVYDAVYARHAALYPGVRDFFVRY